MEKILEKLYKLHIEDGFYPYGRINHENEKKEWELYHYLYQNLHNQEKQIFLEYTNLKEERYKEELKSVYEYGFKEAIQLIAEALKD